MQQPPPSASEGDTPAALGGCRHRILRPCPHCAPRQRSNVARVDENMKECAMKRRSAIWFAGGLAIGALTAAAVTPIVTAEPSTPPVFYGCEKDGSLVPGSLSVGAEPDCNGGATLISWNQAGVDGATGPQGP